MKQTIKRRLASAGLLLLIPALASAGIIININDTGPNGSIPIATVSGFDPTSYNAQFNPEAFDLHGEYFSTLNIPNGTSVSVNFNFYDGVGSPDPNLVSDTLNIVFTGHTPTAGDINNVSVDLHFRSDTDPFGLPPLTNGISITELNGVIMSLQGQFPQGAPTDFNISVASGVPEPGTWGMILVGGAGMLYRGFRMRRSSK
jgi:hypothetical protein